MTSEEIAQELDINYERSLEGRVYGLEMDELKGEGRIQKLEYKPDLYTYSFWDFGVNDATAVGIAQVAPMGREVYILHYKEFSNMRDIIGVAAKWLKSHTYDDGVVDRPYTFTGHFGDPSGKNREITTGRSIFEYLMNNHKIQMEARKTRNRDKFHAVKMLLPKTFIDERLPLFVKRLSNYHRERDLSTGLFREEPVHDENSHGADAFGYFAVNYGEDRRNAEDMTPVAKKIRELMEKQRGGDESNQYRL
jgi:hypothetical protein